MSEGASKPPVRVRVRTRAISTDNEHAPEARLVADEAERPRKKREPNSGSFKKGAPSPNPNGRPKGAKGIRNMVAKILSETTIVRTPKGPKKITLLQGLLLKERDLAFKGDWRARKTLIELGRWALPEEAGPGSRTCRWPRAPPTTPSSPGSRTNCVRKLLIIQL